ERFTRRWALSGVFSALGICTTVAVYGGLAGSLLPLRWLLGNTLVFSSVIVAWCGLRSYYQRQSGDWPWMLVIAYAV
ncbi:hypothetical protein ABTE84_21785, partial [Acinetobacter baumannii]